MTSLFPGGYSNDPSDPFVSVIPTVSTQPWDPALANPGPPLNQDMVWEARIANIQGDAGDVIRPPWMPPELWYIWLTDYIDNGGAGNPNAAAMATEAMRNHSSYDVYFAGNRREDGSLRLSEADYFNTMESYRTIVGDLNINADLFSDEYVALIEGNVSPNEFRQRAEALYTRVLGTASEIRAFYAEMNGIDMTDQAILASLMSETVGNAILNRQITIAEVGGEAAMVDFDIATSFAGQLADAGMDRDEANRLFGSARMLIPMLSRMAARHGDPNDPFDLYEFTDAAFFNDPQASHRVNLVQAQEQAGFTGGAAIDVVRDRRGGLSGLTEI